MDRNKAKQLAETTSGEDIMKMFEDAKSKIKDWTRVSRVNKHLTIGYSYNLFIKGLSTIEDYERIHGMAKINMIWEFGEYLPNYKKDLKQRSRKIAITHQEPIFNQLHNNTINKKMNKMQENKPKEFPKGLIASETQFYVVVGDIGHQINLFVNGDESQLVSVSKSYAEEYLFDTDSYNEVKSVTQTEMIEVVKSNPYVAMSASFVKADKPKTKKQINEEVESAVKSLTEKALSTPIEVLLTEALNTVITDVVKGGERVMKGYFNGVVDERGRFEFIDMEDNNIQKAVDSRTLFEVIVRGVKYIIKK